MTEKLVTYEDLALLRSLRGAVSDGGVIAALLDRLVAAAEADAPPLPEGWYLWRHLESGAATAVHVKGSRISRWDDGDGLFGEVGPDNRHRLTPLRPTVSEADVEKARWVILDDGVVPRPAVMRAAFKAAGIEVHEG